MKAIDDELTGVRSRAALMSALQRCVMQSNEQRTPMAVLVVDVDGFAQINNVHGYQAGDEVLRHLAAQLGEVARPHDVLARIGSDRFVLLLNRILNRGHAELAIQKIFRLMDVPLQTRSVRFGVGVSVGAALCPMHATHPELVLRLAEAALSNARSVGHRHAYAPDAEVGLGISDVWDLELQLPGAIERGEMELHYQPQVCAADLSVIGAEALMRWKTPGRGYVSPAVFIPMAERTGEIRKLTSWALNTALRHAAEWAPERCLGVSVNLPGMLVTEPDLPEIVEAALRLWGTERVALTLEITEGSLMDSERAFASLARLRELGTRVSIDDFGTGYSCLAYFRDIPADELKIDQSFIKALLVDPATADITRFIVNLAQRFNLSVSAEGVEDEATLRAVQALGCQTVQGYLIGKAMPSSAFRRWLQEYRQGCAA